MIVTLAPPRLFTEADLARFTERTGETLHIIHDVKSNPGLLAAAEILLIFGELNSEILQACPRLKWLFSLSAGMDLLPWADLVERGIVVSNVRGIHGTQMAEHTIGIMIAFSRQLNWCYRSQLRREWRSPWTVNELTGQTLSIIGAGSIGKEIAKKAKAFDMKVIGIKRNPEPLAYFDEVWGLDQLHRVLGAADYHALITPLTEETYHLIGAAEFQAMKPTSIFINISRGDTVDEKAMLAALQNGEIAGAGLDVFSEEPLPSNSPFWELPNVIITPHSSGKSPYYMQRALELFTESLLAYRQGKSLPNQIDPSRKY